MGLETDSGAKVSGVSSASESPESESMKSVDTIPSRFALSFSGCGFLGCYHFGVVNCFNKNAKVSLY